MTARCCFVVHNPDQDCPLEAAAGLRFYLGTNYNIPGHPGGGCALARKLIRAMEGATGDHCTSRWPYSAAHVTQGNRLTISITDIIDISSSDYVILIPLTPTARGCHVELGLSLGLDKPTFLYRPNGEEGTGFDSVAKPCPPEWRRVIDDVLKERE